MDRLIYTALSGLRRAEFAQGLTAHNLANLSTPGFQRDHGLFAARWLEGETFEARVQAGAALAASSLQPGPVQATGNPLDVALEGSALLAVEAPDGGEAYGRRGDLRLAPDGRLTTGDGRTVLGADGAPIVLPALEALSIAPDGTILGREPGAADPAPAPVAQLKLVAFDPAMRKGADGWLRLPGAAPAAADPAARLRAGALEGSNVSLPAELVAMVEQSRAFETQTRLVGIARDLDQAGQSLMRLSR
jgi:flagellar basal-body rod protein FlgF